MTGLRLVEYHDGLAQAFHDINAEWINAMFVMEKHDREVLEQPQHYIIDPGGVILFVEADGLGLVGACALMPVGGGAWELTKMGVLERARGRKAGEFLLDAVLDRAADMPVETLFLLTSKRCEAAIHLYEKLGFAHSAEVMARYGASYARCDVAMGFDISGRRTTRSR
jgi:ribosomal protein S18 acetylase RimI-like enzyme